MKFNRSLYDASCDTNDLSDYGIEKCDFSEAESVCDEKKFADLVCYDNNNIGLKIMERMGFKGKDLGKHEQGLKNPIETTIRRKYAGLGYDACSGKINKGSRESVEGINIVQCSHCKRKGHIMDRC